MPRTMMVKTNWDIAKRVVATVFAAGLLPLAADVMDNKAAVLKTVETEFSGTAEVTCDDTKGWAFDVSASVDDGRDVVTVRISRPEDADPPKFGVFFRVPGAGVQNVWTSNHGTDGFHLWPRLWWKWKAASHSELANEMPVAVGFNSAGVSPVALACSEAFNSLEFGLYADDRTCEMVGRCEFFTAPAAPLKEYEASVMLDRRGGDFAETVRQCSEWVAAKNGFVQLTLLSGRYPILNISLLPFLSWFLFY